MSPPHPSPHPSMTCLVSSVDAQKNVEFGTRLRRKDVKQAYSNAPIADIQHGLPLDNYAGLATEDLRPRQICTCSQPATQKRTWLP